MSGICLGGAARRPYCDFTGARSGPMHEGERDMPSPKLSNSIIKRGILSRNLSNGMSRITDLSSELHLSKSTTHRLLKSLDIFKLVTQGGTETRICYELRRKSPWGCINLCTDQKLRVSRDARAALRRRAAVPPAGCLRRAGSLGRAAAPVFHRCIRIQRRNCPSDANRKCALTR